MLPGHAPIIPAGSLYLIDVIRDLGLAGNLKLCLDAGDAQSYTSGQSWLDRSGNGQHYFLGATGGSEASDPAFVGPIGSLNAYWSGTTDDYFTFNGVTPTWQHNLHKNNALLTFFAAVWLPVTQANHYPIFANTFVNTEIGVLWYVRQDSGGNLLDFTQVNGAGASAIDAGQAVTKNQWAIVGVSVNEAGGAGASFHFCNGTISTFDGAYTAPSASNATRKYDIWALGNGQFPVHNGGRLASIAVWEGTALSQAQMAALFQAIRARWGFGPGNDAFTKILLHFIGSDGSTFINDNNAGGSPHTWTASGNAQIDTAISKFDGSTLLLDGTGDSVDTPDHADYTLGSGDWTAETLFYRAGGDGTRRFMFGQSATTGAVATQSICLELNDSNVLRGFVSNGTTNTAVTGTTIFTSPGWHHVAFVRIGNILKLFIDGVPEGGDVAFIGAVNNSANAFAVGALGEFATLRWFGSLKEFRLSVGIARWTTTFTPPKLPYG